MQRNVWFDERHLLAGGKQPGARCDVVTTSAHSMHVTSADGASPAPLPPGMLTCGPPSSLVGGSAVMAVIVDPPSHDPEPCRFPKLDECAHFHYERVQLPPHVQVTLQTNMERSLHSQHSAERDDGEWFMVQVTSGDECWLLQRNVENFRMLDSQLHQCIYDRKVSQLPDLVAGGGGVLEDVLAAYLQRFSGLADNSINCGPVLNWLQMDNKGHRLLVPSEESRSINTPAVAAAYSVRRYVSQARDELSLEVGDMISVIDMACPGESLWWRGKRGFQVGFFPQHCVHIIGDKVPRNMPLPPPVVGSTLAMTPIKPVLCKHGKLIAFFRSFLLNRPSRRRLKQTGILRERVFGCDLGEHLLNSGCDVPTVLRCCADFIESKGIVHGIYRLSGATSNIQRLRNAFDEDRVPDLHTEDILQDIHSVASLLKMYFRELPNPLCTHQLYQKFVAAVQGCTTTRSTQHDHARLLKMREAVQKLPPPHYRTLEYLARHLAAVATHAERTGMTVRNVAIVWAPNLLRCVDLEFGGVAALQGVGVQAVVTEFLICYADLIFCDNLSARLPLISASSSPKRGRPKSLAISTPTKLITLEEARTKQQCSASSSGYIEVGGGPDSLPKKYHTVIELPLRKRANSTKARSPLGWRSLFSRSRGNRAKPTIVHNLQQQKHQEPLKMTSNEVVDGETSPKMMLRSVKSVESLKSLSDLDQLPPLQNVLAAKAGGHNRSVSHDSYFDTLQSSHEGSLLDLSEIQVNFALEEAEMRIFSEDESLVSSPRRVRVQDSGHPSPKKQPRVLLLSPEAASRKRTRLEEQLGDDIQFIDCSTPEMGVVVSVVAAQVHVEDAPRNKSPRSSQCLDDPTTPTPTTPTYKLLESSGSPSMASSPTYDSNVLTTISITYKSPAKSATRCVPPPGDGATEDAQIPTSTASLPLQAAKVEDADSFPTCDTTLSELIDSYDRIAKATSGDWSHVERRYENVDFAAAPSASESSNQEKRKSANVGGDELDVDVYQQVKYLRRSVHEINELLDLSPAHEMAPPCNDSLEAAGDGEVKSAENVEKDAEAYETIEFGDSLETAPPGDAKVKQLTSRFEMQRALPPCVRSRNCKSSLKATRSLDETEFVQSAVGVTVAPSRRNSMHELNAGANKTSTLPKTLNKPKQLPEDPEMQQHVMPHQQQHDVNLNRERIEKYKEERRKFLHDKYRSESFKEDKDVLLSRFKVFKTTMTTQVEAVEATAAPSVANGVRARTAIFEGDVVELRGGRRTAAPTQRNHSQGALPALRVAEMAPLRKSLEQPPLRKDKLAASYCIKDMKALFESKSQQ